MPVMNTEAGRQAKFNQLAESLWHRFVSVRHVDLWKRRFGQGFGPGNFPQSVESNGQLKDIKAAKSWLITILRREYARTFERKVPKFTDVDTVVVPEDSELEPDDRTEIRHAAAEYPDPGAEISGAAHDAGGAGL